VQLSTDIAAAHANIILDACCVITLSQTGRMSDILRALPKPVAVADYVHDKEILQFDLQSLIDQRLLTVVSTESEDEQNTLVNLAVYLDDGEAITGAIAIHRNWAIATDDRKALALFARIAPQIELISTLQLIKYWTDAENSTHEEIRNALYNMHLGAPYEPKSSHPLYSWWQVHISQK
jgi:predicted nucleic acid-binding protein